MITVQTQRVQTVGNRAGYNGVMSRKIETTRNVGHVTETTADGVRCRTVSDAQDAAGWTRATELDERLAAAMQRARERAQIDRATFCTRVPGLNRSTLAAIESGAQRITVGALVGHCAVTGAAPVRLLVEAEAMELPLDVDQVIDVDPTLDDLGRDLVRAALISARRATEARAAERKPKRGR